MATTEGKMNVLMQSLDKEVQTAVAERNKSYAPPEHRGIHELISEIEELIATLDDKVQIVKRRLAEFDSLQTRFYGGEK